MTCPTLARLQQDEQARYDVALTYALTYPQGSWIAGYYSDCAGISKMMQEIHKRDCPLCRDAVAQEAPCQSK